MFYNNVIIVTISVGCFGMILVEYFHGRVQKEAFCSNLLGSIQKMVGFV